MIYGSGLIANAMRAIGLPPDVVVYAAGVSNSQCDDRAEFERESSRLSDALALSSRADRFVYFGTCSADDPASRRSPYVQHKLAMEQMVSHHARHLIIRLPQVAGRTPNPHTLLNFLYARISRSESFELWRDASRNVIDVDDVAKIVLDLVCVERAMKETINVANPRSYPMGEIVRVFEQTLGKRAVYTERPSGSSYRIGCERVGAAVRRTKIDFSDGYLERVIGKYYG